MTCYSVYSLWIFAMAFFTVFVYCVTIGEGISSLAIYRYAPNTNRVGTKPSRLVVLLRALNAIYKIVSLLILGSLMAII